MYGVQETGGEEGEADMNATLVDGPHGGREMYVGEGTVGLGLSQGGDEYQEYYLPDPDDGTRFVYVGRRPLSYAGEG